MILCVTGLCYSPLLKADFIDLDDRPIILHNTSLQNVSWFTFKQTLQNQQTSHISPLGYLSLAWDRQIWKTHALGFHASNLLFYFLGIIVLYVFMTGLIRHHTIACFLTLLFAIHPTHVASVTWISSRSIVLSALFCLAALTLFQTKILRQEPYGWGMSLGIGLCYSLGLLASWRLIFLPAILLIMDMMAHRHLSLKQFAKSRINIHVILGLLSIIYLLIITSGLIRLQGQGLGLDVRKVYLIFRFFLWPFPSSIIYPIGVISDAFAILGTALFLGFLYLLFHIFLRRHRFGHTMFFFLLGTILFSILFTGGDYFTHRLSFFPSLGLIFFLGLACDVTATRHRKTIPWMLGCMTLMASITGPLTWHHNTSWNNAISVWTNVKTHYPKILAAYNHLGKLYLEENKLDLAKQELQAAIHIDPEDIIAYINLGLLQLKQGFDQDAYETFLQAANNNPDSDLPHYHLYLLACQQNNNTQAQQHLKDALYIKPDSHIYRSQLAELYAKDGHIDLAIQEYQKTVELNPVATSYYRRLGQLYLRRGQDNDAVTNFAIVLRSQPHDLEVKYEMGLIFLRQTQYRQARKLFRDVIKRDPLNYKACHYLANTLVALQEEAKAHDYYAQALKLHPHYYPALYDQGRLYAKQGKNTQALKCWHAVLKINPAMMPARNAIAHWHSTNMPPKKDRIASDHQDSSLPHPGENQP